MGNRILEETEIDPKLMFETGGRPTLLHTCGSTPTTATTTSFSLGYKGVYIKRWMLEYSTLQGDPKVSLKDGQVRVLEGDRED